MHILKSPFSSTCSLLCLSVSFHSVWIHQGNQTPPVEYFKRPYRSVATDPPRTAQKLKRISRANMIALQNEQLVKCLCIDGITFNDSPGGMKGFWEGLNPNDCPSHPENTPGYFKSLPKEGSCLSLCSWFYTN